MTLWRRAPREVYRVYGEDEYLADISASVEGAPSEGAEPHPRQAHEYEPARHAVAAPRSPGSRSGRLVGLGLLAGVTFGALGLVIVNATHRPAIVPRTGVPHVARTGMASHASATAPIGPTSVVLTYNGHSSPARASARMRNSSSTANNVEPVLAGRSAQPISEAALAPLARPRSIAPGSWWPAAREPAQPGAPEPSRSDTTAPHAGGEFDFEFEH